MREELIIRNMKDDFRLLAHIYDLIIKPKQEISWLKYICNSHGNEQLLDVGGGTGRVAEVIEECFTTIILYDVSLSMLKKAVDKNNKFLRVCGEIEKIAFEKNQFNTIIMVDTLHHVVNHQQTISSILGVLKPGGIFILEEPDIRKFQVKIIALLEKIMFMRSHFLKPEQILKWIDIKKFTIDLVEEDFNFYFVIHKKKAL